jgi:hypothetical protein
MKLECIVNRAQESLAGNTYVILEFYDKITGEKMAPHAHTPEALVQHKELHDIGVWLRDSAFPDRLAYFNLDADVVVYASYKIVNLFTVQNVKLTKVEITPIV